MNSKRSPTAKPNGKGHLPFPAVFALEGGRLDPPKMISSPEALLGNLKCWLGSGSRGAAKVRVSTAQVPMEAPGMRRLRRGSMPTAAWVGTRKSGCFNGPVGGGRGGGGVKVDNQRFSIQFCAPGASPGPGEGPRCDRGSLNKHYKCSLKLYDGLISSIYRGPFDRDLQGPFKRPAPLVGCHPPDPPLYSGAPTRGHLVKASPSCT